MQMGALLVEKLWSDGKRLRPREVVTEFDKTIHDELDLGREAANCSQLRRNFLYSPLLLVPEVYWDWCASEVMVMERMEGTPISQVARLRDQEVDIPRLARAGRPRDPRSRQCAGQQAAWNSFAEDGAHVRRLTSRL